MIAEMSEFDKKVAEVANRAYADIVEHEQNRCLKIVQPGESVQVSKKLTIDDLLFSNRKAAQTLSFGIRSLDNLFSGYSGGELRIGAKKQSVIGVTAMSGTGKSLLTFTMFANLYKMHKEVLYISLDMDEEDTADYFRYSLIGMKSNDLVLVDEIALVGKKFNIVSAPEGKKTVKFIEDEIIKYQNETGKKLDAVFIDFFGRLVPGVQVKESEQNAVIMEQLKALKIKYNCMVIILIQAREDVAYKGGRPTQMSSYGGVNVRSYLDALIGVYRASKNDKSLDARFKSFIEISSLKDRVPGQLDDTCILKTEDGKLVEPSWGELKDYKETVNPQKKVGR